MNFQTLPSFSFSLLRKILILVGILWLNLTVSAQPGMNYEQIGINFIRQGEYIKALENFNYAIIKDPSFAELYFRYQSFSLLLYLNETLNTTIMITETIAAASIRIVNTELVGWGGSAGGFGAGAYDT